MEIFLVTGANRGIGLALTRAFLASGNTVIAGCRRPSESSDLKLLSLLHPEAMDVVKCDLNSENEHD
jgi:NAD(P)-dependent dehydrogenase (short-subunit alcohol dehydrogenase family)